MHSQSLACAFLTVTLLPWLSPSQEPASQGPPPEEQEKKRPFFDVRARSELIAKELPGVWQLVRAELTGTSLAPGDVKGFLIIVDGTLSLEIHFRSSQHLPDTQGLFFQTGVHRWRMDEAGKLATYSMIGTNNMTPSEEVEFEPPGIRREFTVTLIGDELVLSRTGRPARYPGETAPIASAGGRGVPAAVRVRGDSQAARMTWRRVARLPFPGAPPESPQKK